MPCGIQPGCGEEVALLEPSMEFGIMSGMATFEKWFLTRAPVVWIDDVLKDLRRQLDQLREMEYTTEWADVEQVEEEQDRRVEPEDMTPKPANPVEIAPCIPMSPAEEDGRFAPKRETAGDPVLGEDRRVSLEKARIMMMTGNCSSFLASP
jgi:hypothetical protein